MSVNNSNEENNIVDLIDDMTVSLETRQLLMVFTRYSSYGIEELGKIIVEKSLEENAHFIELRDIIMKIPESYYSQNINNGVNIGAILYQMNAYIHYHNWPKNIGNIQSEVKKLQDTCLWMKQVI